MLVGLTYDLRLDYKALGLTDEQSAEFDSPETIDALHKAISSLGHEVVSIGNIFELNLRLCSKERWDLVFNICEGLNTSSRESQVPALLDAFGIAYTFADPISIGICHDKAIAKTIARASGIPTADFAVISSISDLKSSVLQAYPLFVKPLSEGTGKGIDEGSVVFNYEGLVKRCGLLLDTYRQPVLVEDYLPGREYTVGIVGTGHRAKAVGVLEVVLNEGADALAYSYKNKELCESLVTYELVSDKSIIKEAEDIALSAYKALGLRDAGRADIRADGEGRLHFIEMNPLAGLHPTHSDLPIMCTKAGMTYIDLIETIVESASLRIDGSISPELKKVLKLR